MLDLTNWLMVFLRASALLAVFPIFSAGNVPVRIRLALGAIVAGLVGASLPAVAPAGDLWGLVGQMAGEIGIGLAFGFTTRMVFFGLEIAGAIITTDMGLSMPSLMDPISNNNLPVPATLLYLLATVIFLSLDLHQWLLVGFQRTYALLPVGSAHLSPLFLTEVVSEAGQTFQIGLQLAAPMMAVSFLISLALSALGRAAPTMGVFGQSLAIRPLAGLMIFGLCADLLAQHIANYLRHLPEDMLRVALIMRGG